jgi:hypothetical protein
LIAEDVTTLAEHHRRLCDPDGYRPASCPGCACPRLHVHDYRSRVLAADAEASTTTVVRHRCVECLAAWTILPACVARQLWRRWAVVEAATIGPKAPASAPRVPGRTVRRWKARLRSAARRPLQAFATSGHARLAAMAQVLGLEATREALVRAWEAAGAALGGRLSGLAAWIHRLAPGLRLV